MPSEEDYNIERIIENVKSGNNSSGRIVLSKNKYEDLESTYAFLLSIDREDNKDGKVELIFSENVFKDWKPWSNSKYRKFMNEDLSKVEESVIYSEITASKFIFYDKVYHDSPAAFAPRSTIKEINWTDMKLNILSLKDIHMNQDYLVVEVEEGPEKIRRKRAYLETAGRVNSLPEHLDNQLIHFKEYEDRETVLLSRFDDMSIFYLGAPTTPELPSNGRHP